MAHEITVLNGVAGFAYVGCPAWHGLGQQVEKGASVDTILGAAGLSFTVKDAPVRFEVSPGEWRTDEGSRVLYRDDTGAALGVVGSQYTPHQPGEIIAPIMEALSGAGWYIETAGSLNGGARVFFVCKNDEGASVPGLPGDWVDNRLFVSTSFNGTSPTRGLQTSVRVVCANTWREATLENAKGGKRRAAQSHRGAFNAGKMVRDLGLDTAAASFAETMRQAGLMAQQGVSAAEARALVDSLLRGRAIKASDILGRSVASITDASMSAEVMASTPTGADTFAALLAAPARVAPVARLDVADEKQHRNTEKILSLWTGQGMGAEMGAGTLWGLFNAITEHVDHHAGRGNEETRFVSAQYGLGEQLKANAAAAFLS